MTFYHGTTAKFYYHTLDMSCYVEQVDTQLSRSLAEYRPLCQTAVTRVPGARDARIALTGGALDVAAGLNDELAFNTLDNGTVASWAFLPMGDALGRVCYCGTSLGENQQRVAGDDIIRLPVAMVTAKEQDRAVVLRALAAGGVSPGASVNNSAPTTNGGVGYLICTAVSTTLDVVIEDSANNTDWATLVTFAQLAGGTEGSQAIAVTGTVRQYLRATWTIGGTATFFVAFGRR